MRAHAQVACHVPYCFLITFVIQYLRTKEDMKQGKLKYIWYYTDITIHAWRSYVVYHLNKGFK